MVGDGGGGGVEVGDCWTLGGEMTEGLRRKAVRRLRGLLDGGLLRKAALMRVQLEFGIGRSTLYAWCVKFGISTR